MFNNAKWIWSKEATGTDCYAEFVAGVNLNANAEVRMLISVDSNYALYINGTFAESGQYGDYPHYKVYDEIDISRFVRAGENRIAIIVWYYGESTQNYSVGKPGLIFEIEQNGTSVLSSGPEIRSRKSRRYLSGMRERITSQLGFTFHADLTESNAWMTADPDESFKESAVCAQMPENLIARPIKKLQILDLKEGKTIRQGVFIYETGDGNNGARMQNAALTYYEDIPGACLPRKNQGEGLFYIVDLQAETAGYLDFELDVPEDCAMEIGWGEHLTDGRCRTEIGNRNFSAAVRLKAGKNAYMNPFRRLGCRYLQLFIHTDRVKIGRLGIRPTVYPLKIKEYKSGDPLRDKIYATCRNTLIQCMHEHYEDCPWREQAFYTLDSRNQMLCGYYAFHEYAFPRAGLRLLAQSLKEDGLLTICAPSDAPTKIVSFSLFYIIELAEYYRYSHDSETVKFCFETAKRIIDTFAGRIDETGLIANFEGKEYWNFYEWQPHLDGKEKTGKRYDTCLNALLSIALENFAVLLEAIGSDPAPYLEIKERLNGRIRSVLFDPESGLLRLYSGQKSACYSVLANALGFLSGAFRVEEAEAMLALILKNPEQQEPIELIPTSLSMDTFRYEALLKADPKKYAKPILEEIDRVYSDMLRQGATSFWETKKGEADFKGAGSLCHGWSAMPIYYYERLFSNGE